MWRNSERSWGRRGRGRVRRGLEGLEDRGFRGSGRGSMNGGASEFAFLVRSKKEEPQKSDECGGTVGEAGACRVAVLCGGVGRV
jgi:hypothetical protein